VSRIIVPLMTVEPFPQHPVGLGDQADVVTDGFKEDALMLCALVHGINPAVHVGELLMHVGELLMHLGELLMHLGELLPYVSKLLPYLGEGTSNFLPERSQLLLHAAITTISAANRQGVSLWNHSRVAVNGQIWL
jgi:hypothetical protein